MTNTGITIQTNETDLVSAINNSKASDNVVYTVLKTDERVIARVTDGIYRQPASALRELISNAYDADATRVVIKTDAPRFSRISIEDNGHGMTPEALAHMLMHIGGSAKRQTEGKDLGITSLDNPTNSPEGRKLIGKIGIGIFSVAQLTYNFQIITKTKNDNFRTIAVVNLRQYSDEYLNQDNSEDYESGKVSIWREKALDLETHGTTIILNNIKPQARDTLQSKEIWTAVEHSEQTFSTDEITLDPPKFHVGKVDATGQMLRGTEGKTNSVPWIETDSPKEAFAKLVDSVWNEIDNANPNPQLDKIFDYYLQMIWNLSLAVPLPYVQDHIFNMNLSDWTYSYLVANEPRGAAKMIENKDGENVRDIIGLSEGKSALDFEVFIDDLQLFRPIKFEGLPTSGHALKKPLVLIGKCKEEFAKFPAELSGGPLNFEAYLFWTPKVAPTEHRGSLIRINGSSGTLFDPTFMRYQIAEQTRLKQITCEIFIHEGFDSALNIDRESFNFAHPHSVFLTRWLHSALRQLATTQKRIASEVRTEVRGEIQNRQKNEIQQIALDIWKQETNDEFSVPPVVSIKDTDDNETAEKADIVLVKTLHKEQKISKPENAHSKIQTEKIKAITQILASFGLLEHLTQQQQNRLLNAIYHVLESTE
jgi:hypothetical protein